MLVGGHEFPEVAVHDFEYGVTPGERPTPVCLVVHELVSGRVHRLWQDELWARSVPPVPTGKDTLIVGYYLAGDLACFKALGWPRPERILDVYVEFRAATNGLVLPAGASLLGALTWLGEDSMSAAVKGGMRALVQRGGPWSTDEKQQILDYCQKDVIACTTVLKHLI